MINDPQKVEIRASDLRCVLDPQHAISVPQIVDALGDHKSGDASKLGIKSDSCPRALHRYTDWHHQSEAKAIYR
jgi:hypothetical protein